MGPNLRRAMLESERRRRRAARLFEPVERNPRTPAEWILFLVVVVGVGLIVLALGAIFGGF